MVRHHHRGGARRINFFQLELNTMPQSGMTGYYFPFNYELAGYDMSSYNSSYSDNTISQHEVAGFINEINALPETPVSTCNCLSCLLALILPLCIFGMVGATLGIMLNLQRSTYVYNPTTGTSSYQTTGIPLTTAIISVVVIDVTLIAVLVTSIVCINKHTIQKALARKNAITQVINKYQPQFDAKNVILRLSTHGAYIAMEFKWRALNAGMLQLQAAQMLLGGQGFFAMPGGMGMQPVPGQAMLGMPGGMPPGSGRGTFGMQAPGLAVQPNIYPPGSSVYQDSMYQNPPPVFS